MNAPAPTTTLFSRAELARDCLMRLERALDRLAALDHSGRWPWSRRLSVWCDALVILSEERAA